ncbi:MAG: DEAD/DEAH box helicase [Succinivibrio sp.]|nr:DEAD/DEAH box helicase [Succinivibrio sp.]
MAYLFANLGEYSVGVDQDTHKMCLRTPYAFKERCKSIPFSRWDPENKVWVYPICPTVLKAYAEQFAPSAALLERLQVYSQPDPQPRREPPSPHVEVAVSEDLVRLYATYEDKDRCKAIPGGRWDPQILCWCYPLSSKSVDALAKSFPALPWYDTPLEADTSQNKKLPQPLDIATVKEKLIKQRHAEITSSKALDSNVEIAGLGGELLPYQRAGVAYALRKKRCFIADEMGLGKTVEALATLQAAEAFPALIITPAVVKLNWLREAKRWLPGRRALVLGSGADKGKKDSKQTEITMDEAELVIINYDILSRNKELNARPWRALVLDESHYVKNYKAQRTKAVLDLALKGKIEYRLLLSGTPLLSRPVELLSQLRILGKLGDLGGRQYFLEHYCDAQATRFGMSYDGAKNLKELNTELRSSCYVRRNKKDVLTELPPKRVCRVELELGGSARRSYNLLMADFRAFIAERRAQGRKAYSEGSSAEALTRLNAAKQVVAEGKLEGVLSWVEDFLESGEKLVLFAVHLNIIAAIMEHFGEQAVRITGADSPQAREKAVSAFQESENTRLIVLQLQAGGVGITLTAASNVAFAELGWTPGEHEQAEDRCHRLGQQHSVNCWYLLAEDTIEQDIAALIDSKRAVVSAAADGKRVKAGRNILSELTDLIEEAGGESD